MINFKDLQLPDHILKAIKEKNYTEPTPIQAKAVPPLMKGKDLLGIAQTGTGKTAAFSWPIIARLSKSKVKTKPRCLRALILTPTRELASQISENIRTYSKGTGVFCGVIFGGVGKKGQVTMMNRGCDILIATPGRLLDLMSENHISFEQLEVFVLDEADRMLDMGFIHDIKKVIAKLPPKRQNMLFSATMPESITSLANSLLTNALRVEVTPENTTVEKIDQKIFMVKRTDKMSLLKDLLEDNKITSALVFTRTKHGADRMVRDLNKQGITAEAIHGNKSQGARERALKSFKSGEIRLLIATDIAARGIDIDRVSHVINYNLPEEPESYVHRIGRTARAGREGASLSFCAPAEVKLLKSIEKFISYEIPIEDNHEFHTVHTQAQIELEEKEKKAAKSKRFSKKTNKLSSARPNRNKPSNKPSKKPSKKPTKKIGKKKTRRR